MHSPNQSLYPLSHSAITPNICYSTSWAGDHWNDLSCKTFLRIAYLKVYCSGSWFFFSRHVTAGGWAAGSDSRVALLAGSVCCTSSASAPLTHFIMEHAPVSLWGNLIADGCLIGFGSQLLGRQFGIGHLPGFLFFSFARLRGKSLRTYLLIHTVSCVNTD